MVRLGLVVLVACGSAHADLENQVFTSKPDQIRVVIPRGWRATEQPSYPDLLLWLVRDTPEGRIALTAEPFTHALWCSWPVACARSHDSLPVKYACALRSKLESQKLHVGPTQSGPKDNETAGLPSVWFEYDDGKHFLRQAIAMNGDRAVSLVLSAPTSDARGTYVRAFEQTLRTLRPLTADELAEGSGASGSGSGSSAVGSGSATAPPDDAGIQIPAAPPPGPPSSVNPTAGPCP